MVEVLRLFQGDPGIPGGSVEQILGESIHQAQARSQWFALGCRKSEVVGDLILYICSCKLTLITRKVNVKNLTTGETFIDEADIVVGARGGLTRTLWPEIDGLWDFAGKIVHSGHWDEK